MSWVPEIDVNIDARQGDHIGRFATPSREPLTSQANTKIDITYAGLPHGIGSGRLDIAGAEPLGMFGR